MRLLAELHDHLYRRPDAPLPAHLVAAVRRALDRYADGCTLAQAFETGDRRRRDSALRRAAELLAPDRGTWTQAGLVLQAVTRFRDAKREPRTPAEEVFLVAIAEGCPGTQRQIYTILRDRNQSK